MIVDVPVPESVPTETKVVENKPAPAHSSYYKEKYNESDFVLMFYNPTAPLEQWMVKDLLETIDVRARGIRQGKTGKCYADFENEEIWKQVKELSGTRIGDHAIIVCDVPPRTDTPNNSFNKKGKTPKGSFKNQHNKKGTFGQKKSFEKKEEKQPEKEQEKKVKKKRKLKKKNQNHNKIDGIKDTKNHFAGI
ncbi:RRM domain-containing protein [Entamoeba marina]